MRKLTCALLCLLMILSTAFCLAGCKSREQRLNEETAYEETQMKAVREKVIRCIKKDDKEGLKKLFSKSAQKDIEDLDGKIDELLEAFKGKSIVSVKSESAGSSRTNDYGKKSIIIYGDYTLKLSTKGKCTIFISFCDKNDENSDDKGVFQMELRMFSKEETPKDFSGGAYQDDHGIFIYTLQNYPKK
ncbi:DUF5104 domain-containing protein [Mogibacterium pumilum]|uniref:DUF5104 domain-containing protein n=1 Tax=Mogibacterium pumilum TaxID=86332 RepID=A0A223ATV5_9FIRM|nr:DUF5104 domain-containing protein [Mogibacterium pumilum]ASS38403.1 hypothetical protein AXF17_08370 [Mogibacterium pumilum]